MTQKLARRVAAVGAGCVAALLGLWLSAAPASAQGALVERLTLPIGNAAAEARSATQLVPRATYRLVVTGVVTNTGPGVVERYDALYCYERTPLSIATHCNPATPNRAYAPYLVVELAGRPRVPLFSLGTPALIPYQPSHGYEKTFTAEAGGGLVLRPGYGVAQGYSLSGSFTVELHEVARPAPPPTT